MTLDEVLKTAIVATCIAMALIVPIAYVRGRSRRLARALELYHAERMAALERGFELPPLSADTVRDLANATQRATRTALLPGLIWTCVGVAILVADVARDIDDRLAMGLVPFGIGIAYLIYYFLHERRPI